MTSGKVDTNLPESSNNSELAQELADFFTEKISNIRRTIDETPVDLDNMPTPQPPHDLLTKFVPLDPGNMRKLITKSTTASCELDPIPTWLLKETLEVMLPVLWKIINMSLETGFLPDMWKIAVVKPVL